ncbi:FAD/FMN-containing dehydrogenase [Bradyrhizobium sp. USDA 4011]
MQYDARIDGISSILPPDSILAGPGISPKYFTDWFGRPVAPPAIVVRPSGVAELSRLLEYCNTRSWRVVSQGGMTGLVSAALPKGNEVVVSLERMSKIIALDRNAKTMTVEAGITLQQVQESAEEHRLIFPLDLAARGSATIGGVIATNAGGTMVIRFGMTRELVLGLEVVLADGTIVNSMHPYLKNNTGYDIKQNFIGSEGTLGIVTKAILRLFPKPNENAVAICAVPSFPALVSLLGHMRDNLEGSLFAFEAMWESYYELAILLPFVRAPLPLGSPFYALIEVAGLESAHRLESVLQDALRKNIINDAVIAKSTADARAIWRIREAAFEAVGQRSPFVAFDVSMRLDLMIEYLEALKARLRTALGPISVSTIAHLGDNNLHVAVHYDAALGDVTADIKAIFYRITGEYQGSISAEHGIGIDKRDYLHHSRTPEEVALMKTLKRSLDPNNILNPDRIFVIETQWAD